MKIQLNHDTGEITLVPDSQADHDEGMRFLESCAASQSGPGKVARIALAGVPAPKPFLGMSG